MPVTCRVNMFFLFFIPLMLRLEVIMFPPLLACFFSVTLLYTYMQVICRRLCSSVPQSRAAPTVPSVARSLCSPHNADSLRLSDARFTATAEKRDSGQKIHFHMLILLQNIYSNSTTQLHKAGSQRMRPSAQQMIGHRCRGCEATPVVDSTI